MAALQFAHATVQRSPPAQQSPSSPLVDQALWPAWQVLTPCPMISGTHALVCSHSQMQGRVSAEAAAAATSLTLILGLPPSLRGHLLVWYMVYGVYVYVYMVYMYMYMGYRQSLKMTLVCMVQVPPRV